MKPITLNEDGVPEELQDFGRVLGFVADNVPNEGVDMEEVKPHSPNGFTLPKAKWKSLKQKIDIFYSHIEEGTIKEWNEKKIKEITAKHKRGEYTEREKELIKPETSNEGYVYLMEGNGYYKIGKSTAPIKRHENLTVKLPFEVEMIHKVKSDQYGKLESFLHNKFSDKCTNGEWFDLNEEDVKYIKELNGDEYK